MSYATQTASVSARPFFFIRIEGIPSFVAEGVAGGSTAQLSLSTLRPDYDSAGNFVAALDLDGMGGTGQRIDPLTYRTDMAVPELPLLDVNMERAGRGNNALTSLFSFVPSAISRLNQATLNAAALTFNVTATGGLAAGDVIYLGRETMRIAAGGIGAGAITVEARGMFASTAAVHEQTVAATGASHADGIYLAPPFWRGRAVTLHANYVGETAGEETQIDEFVLDRIGESSRGVGYSLHCRDNMRRLARSVSRSQFHGIVVADGRPLRVQVIGDGVPSPADLPVSGVTHLSFDDIGVIPFTAYYRGENVIEFDPVLLSGGLIIPIGLAGRSCREVYPCDPTVIDGLGNSLAWFAPIPNGGSATPTANPVKILLCLILSTGAGTNVTAGRTNYDVLPARMGLGIPVAGIDLDAWEALAADGVIADIAIPSYVFGHDGKPINVRAFAEDYVLRMAGAATCILSDGRISVARLGVFYPLQPVADTITTADHNEGESAATLGEEQVLAAVNLTYGAEGKERLYVQAPERQEQYPEETQEVDVKFGGVIGTAGIGNVVDRLVLRIADSVLFRRWTGRLFWSKHRLDVGSYVSLTDGSMPNTSGGRGVSVLTAQLLSKQFRFGDAKVEVELLMAPTRNTAHVSPSLRCAAEVAGTTAIDVGANYYTDTVPGDGPLHPTPDVLAFADLASARVMLTSRIGVRRDDNTPTVVSVATGPDRITITPAFKSGGADIAINDGDIIEFAPYDGSTTTQQKKYVALSDASGGGPGATSDAPYVYGA